MTYCALVGDNVVVVVVLQMLLKNAVQPSGLVLVAVHSVLDLFRRISGEVVRLTLPMRCDVSKLYQYLYITPLT